MDEQERERTESVQTTNDNSVDLSAKRTSLEQGQEQAVAFSSEEQNQTRSCPSFWTQVVFKLHRPILWLLHKITSLAVQNPKAIISVSVFISLGLLIIGFATSFQLEVDERVLWTPRDSKPYKHKQWIQDSSGFPKEPRELVMGFHANGGNVLGREPVRRVFTALDAVRSLPDYDKICNQSYYVDKQTGEHTCQIRGVTKFWNHSATIFDEEVSSDEDAIVAMSSATFPDGTPVPEQYVFGYPKRNSSSGILTSAQLYLLKVYLPLVAEIENFEADILHVLVDQIRSDWEIEPGNDVRIEAVAVRSFPDEFARAIEDDIPLLPFVFIAMAAFCCLIFSKRNAVESQSLLGLAGVVSVLLAIMMTYGFMFLCGVPFSNLTPLLPFIMFGIGLDDTFIIHACYQRTNREKLIVGRIHDTIEDCGVSITLTTMTSTIAFALGCLSSIPAIRWLCLYAFPTVILVLIFQLTFFISCIALDERRLQDKRRDCCIWRTALNRTDESTAPQEFSPDISRGKQVSERLMKFYTDRLMNPLVKIVVIVGFVAFAVACGFSASKLTQQFSHKDVLPRDSYARDLYDKVVAYSFNTGALPQIYFRFLDQSVNTTRQKMSAYVANLTTIESISSPPEFFWLRDFHEFVNTHSLWNRSFNNQLDAFLGNTVYKELYENDIVRDDSGAITSSRCTIHMDNIDWDDVRIQIDALEDQRKITAVQGVNQGQDEWRFFTYHFIYDSWEFYSVMVNALLDTTKIGIIAVTVLSLLFIPHWSAAFFVLPMIMLLYIDLLGVLQWVGVHINPVTYLAMVLSIGLMVDYLMHVLLRYYESKGTRHQKVTEALQTIGVSVLHGGISTFLGTLPLVFSTSEIFMTLFYAFLFLVILGCAHGLIFLPVVLSICGPQD